MAFALLIIGITLIVAAVRNTQQELITLLVGDVTGPNNFLYWILAILLVGSIGYIDKLKPISVGLLALIILVLFITKGRPGDPGSGGFFEKFMQAIGSTQKPANGTTTGTGAVVIPFPGQVSQ